jgi:hypothetical protein
MLNPLNVTLTIAGRVLNVVLPRRPKPIQGPSPVTGRRSR